MPKTGSNCSVSVPENLRSSTGLSPYMESNIIWVLLGPPDGKLVEYTCHPWEMLTSKTSLMVSFAAYSMLHVAEAGFEAGPKGTETRNDIIRIRSVILCIFREDNKYALA